MYWPDEWFGFIFCQQDWGNSDNLICKLIQVYVLNAAELSNEYSSSFGIIIIYMKNGNKTS